MNSKKEVSVGGVMIGGSSPITVQSMTNTASENAEATIAQLLQLQNAGCDIARVSIYNEACAKNIPQLKKAVQMPLVADIHFDHKLAVMSVENGIDKLRINPGNIGSVRNVGRVVAAAKMHGVPIRIGVNGGSLPPELLHKHGGPNADAMVEAALIHVKLLENAKFYNTVLSLKSSTVPTTIAAYEKAVKIFDYPMHLGITEAGTEEDAIIKSSVGLGTLLSQGIGDTVRVSITGEPVKEIYVAHSILRALGLRKEGIEVISCPTCGRCSVDLLQIVRSVKARLPQTAKHLQVAIIGCVVNGPGEAREADIGLAYGPSGCVLFKGDYQKRLSHDHAVDALIHEVSRMVGEL